MVKKIVLVMVFILSLTIIQAEKKETLFKDISKEHWAYYSIENLVYKGIIEPTSDYFNGEREVTKNDLAFYLSKVLNKLDEEKVSKDDLLIIENLVYEFSEDLNKFSFNIDGYTEKLEKINKNIEENKDENTKLIKEINQRLIELEKKDLYNNEPVNIKENQDLNFNKLNNCFLTINTEIKKNESDEKKYKELYEVGFGIKEKDYEIKLKLDEESDMKPILKIQVKKEIFKEVDFIFHTKDYKKELKSYYGNLDYTNYKLTEKKYNSMGFGIGNNFFELLLEQDEEVKVIQKMETKYLNTFLENDFNNKNRNLELVLKYPLFDEAIILSSGYTIQEQDEEKKIYINIQTEYKNETNKYLIGYEKKDGEEALYNNIYGQMEYRVKTNSIVEYKTEILDTPMKMFNNHYFLLKNQSENVFGRFKVSFGINKIGLEKEEIDKDLITPDENDEITDFTKIEYTEMFAKIEYLFKEKYGIQTSYLIKDQNGKKEKFNFVKLYYNLERENKIYIKYLKKNYEDYNDMEKDLNGDNYNMNFDENSNMENNAEDGQFSIGVEFKF